MSTATEDHPAANGTPGFHPPAALRNAGTEIASSRAAQEAMAAMIAAKRDPRDEEAAIARILQSCKRRGLAEAAVYTYPRGGTKVEGPSIRLAEAMAQAWGNLDFGIVELEQRHGESQVMAYCHDLETNVRQTKIFAVKHERATKQATYALTDPRDIYEMVANNGARRLRACILGIIPGDVVDAALEQCNATLRGNAKEPLIDRVRKMVNAFGDMGIKPERIETRLGHKLDATSEAELVALRKVYTSIKDGMGSTADYFPLADAEQGSATDRLKGKLKGGKAKAATPQPEYGPGVAGELPAEEPPRERQPGEDDE